MFQIIDKFNHHLPVKSGFMTPRQALNWAKKNLEHDSCAAWGHSSFGDGDRYFIKMYRN
jgi:hypothetical protein